MKRRIFIFGSSNSILEGGYTSYLKGFLHDDEIEIRNYSIGDQTSVVGLMRLMEHIDEVQIKDIVIWEYPLLDAMLTDSFFDPDAVLLAAISAWTNVLERNAHLIVVEIEPRDHIRKNHPFLMKLRTKAAAFNLVYLQTSCLLSDAHNLDVERFYDDDRHLMEHSEAVSLLAAKLADEICSSEEMKLADENGPAVTKPSMFDRRLIWKGAHQIAEEKGFNKLLLFKNSFVETEGLSLEWPNTVEISESERLVAIGIISSCDSGALWCGHIGCPPVSCRLPSSLSRFSFLLRTTRLPCIRLAQVRHFTAMPEWIPAEQAWADYGQDRNVQVGMTAITGLLTMRLS